MFVLIVPQEQRGDYSDFLVRERLVAFVVDAFLAVVAVDLAVVLVAAVLVAAVLLAAVLDVDAFVVLRLVAVRDDFAGFAASSVAAVVVDAAASARAVLDNAARALPAAVWAPLAFAALPAAIRAFAALAAAALPVVFATWLELTTCEPPSAAFTLRTSRDFRRAAALG